MTIPLLLVVAFTALALGVACLALWFAWGARTTAREALQSTHRHPPPRARQQDSGPPEGEPERRRHRAPESEPEPRYERLRASADAREAATTSIPAVRDDGSRPPLPRPGSIGRDQ